MADSSQLGARFERATLELFRQLLPLLGFEVTSCEPRRSGSQGGFDVFFQARPAGSDGVRVNFFVECKGAGSINLLPPEEFEGKPELLDKSAFDPDYWILLSPLRYLGNDFQELLQRWKRAYPFAFVPWVREAKDADKAGLYLDLYKHFPAAYDIFRQDVPEAIRDLAPERTLDEIVAHLRNSIDNAYDEFQESVAHKGVVPGVRRVTRHVIHKSMEADAAKLARIRAGYYRLNSSDRFVWKVVCNDLDVRNARSSAAIAEAVGRVGSPSATIWVLGAPGCGKTTQMYRTALDCAADGYPVALINSLDLDDDTGPEEYEKYFRLLCHLHSASAGEDSARPLLVLIDNPTARVETVSRLLSRFDGLDESFKCVFLLFEREVRYRQAEEDYLLLDLVGSNTRKIYVDNHDAAFRESVSESFTRALSLPPAEAELARDAFLSNPQISVAEAVINFCKRTRSEYKSLLMDWVDFDRVARQQQWGSLKDLYRWVSPLYQFGVSLPVSVLRKVLDFHESELYNLRDFFDNEEYEHLPLILEGNTLRTRHELIAQWHVEEKLGGSARERLADILKAVETDDALERSILLALLGRKDVVRRYLAQLDPSDFEAIKLNAARHPVSRRLALMATGWAESFKGDFRRARDVFAAVSDAHPDFLPATQERAKMESLLGNTPEAERLLLEILLISPEDLPSRTELAQIYRAQKRYDQAEKLLNECIHLSPDDLYSRTELAKVYQAQSNYDGAIAILESLLKLEPQSLQARTELGKIFRAQKRYGEAERVLTECIKISPDDLNSRTELAKVYQIQKRYGEAERVLKECIKISPDDLNSRTELAKVYQAQGRYEDAERVLKELLELDTQNLRARTELAKVYQALGRYGEAERVLKESLAIDPNQLHPRTELAKVYQVQGRYGEAERVLNELLELDTENLQARTELARVFISQGLFRKARAEVFCFVRDKRPDDYEAVAHLLLTYLNACFRMRRYGEGVDFVDGLGCQFASAELAEEYGRLLRADDLPGAAMFFETALRLFRGAGRLWSEAAVCFKLAGRPDAESVLERAVRLQPDKEDRYRRVFNDPPVSRPFEFEDIDRRGRVTRIDYEGREGAVEAAGGSYSFRWHARFDPLYRSLNANDEVFFDVAARGYAVNVEPAF